MHSSQLGRFPRTYPRIAGCMDIEGGERPLTKVPGQALSNAVIEFIRSKFLEIDGLLSTGDDVIRNIECYIDPVDVALIFICSMVCYLVRKRRQLNRRLLKELAFMKVTCVQNEKVISGLQPYLEDARSKNSTLEMPLRKLARSCGKLDQDVDQKMAEIEGLSVQFSRFKKNWNDQAAPYYETPLITMLAHVEEAKVHAELNRLKKNYW
ncbi:unnamed protein product [Mytilus edulis]|uniref:Uncharacterized protein n=1 Tax=Mytilus edulis TaxID=6550 RepID=A0A8S3VFS9_MYTED|nr:unnamed protein product [Mytilus edulis]